MVIIKVLGMVTKQSHRICQGDLKFRYQWSWLIVHEVLKMESSLLKSYLI